MRILITNDDGYQAKGIKALVEIMKEFGEVTVIAPKHHQSGMSMAVSLGFKQIAHKDLGDGWHYVDATPASCVKFGLNTMFLDNFPDVVVSGINHGSNASTASCYSGTLGAAEEAALNGIPAIGVSLDTLHPDADFSGVSQYFGDIFRKLMADLPQKHGVYYNVNFPDIPADQIKGIRTGYQGLGKWIKEFKEWDVEHYRKYGITPELLGQSSNPVLEEGEDLYMMVGEFIDDPRNTDDADHRIVADGYISIVAHNVDCTDYEECRRISVILNGISVILNEVKDL
ncbi:MAG: 5'/3'-nucleotidase SurE [Bacteroidales bacterium]|nr:5'/3'-nucleotidase SurE [Bacteroidales bacterium]